MGASATSTTRSVAREQRLDQEPSVQGCANKETIKFSIHFVLVAAMEYCRYYLGRRMPEEGGMTPPHIAAAGGAVRE
jgi:hypothetical protein